ncbi:unnamed protein product [Rotaria socialis]|nr:unnamed protein product [Rotaria socialis]CAF3342008.1 unnamed protein product [Rotaria socialis]CAF3350802.1 unnamed protein product [Rotaria socialis]CAF3495053.1 unnamed protein product [Rotaria socialis]CAF4223726.1 unnamed protein product [Rotaria socialis]
MLIKYRSGVVHSKQSVRCLSKLSNTFGRPIVHIRNSFIFKRRTSTWPPTILVNRSSQTMNITNMKEILILSDYDPIFKNSDWGRLTPRQARFVAILTVQFILFFLLLVIGLVFEISYIHSYRLEYKSFSFTNTRLLLIRTTLINDCSNNIDLPCSLQMNINFYFFGTKLSLIYVYSIIIAMIYIWHQTIRLLSCIFALLVITMIVFGTDIILYFDHIFFVTCVVCMVLLVLFSFLRAATPPFIDDQLSILFARHVSSSDRSKFLQNDTSIYSRLYRLVQKMKKQWNIEEEKIIITFAILLISIIIGSILLHLGFAPGA